MQSQMSVWLISSREIYPAFSLDNPSIPTLDSGQVFCVLWQPYPLVFLPLVSGTYFAFGKIPTFKVLKKLNSH